MQNFDWEYLQVMEIASRGCRISMRSILTLSKMWDADAKFAKRVSSNTRKGKMQMQFIHDRQAEKHLQVQRKASCRCVGPQKEHLQQRTSSQCRYNSCHKEHLQQRISRDCRYISYQKSKSLITSPISITVHHKARKRLCNPANWSRACPTKLSRSAQSFSGLWDVVN